jgi:bifunctional DNA-binding transcriptional regulator/antitoxin component of YhaV-PrlF toxin-antitoxin module
MITTVELSDTGQVQLPKAFCKKNKITAGSPLRIFEMGKGLYVTAQEEPDLEELNKLIAESGAPDREATPEEEAMVHDMIAEYRRDKKRRR